MVKFLLRGDKSSSWLGMGHFDWPRAADLGSVRGCGSVYERSMRREWKTAEVWNLSCSICYESSVCVSFSIFLHTMHLVRGDVRGSGLARVRSTQGRRSVGCELKWGVLGFDLMASQVVLDRVLVVVGGPWDQRRIATRLQSPKAQRKLVKGFSGIGTSKERRSMLGRSKYRCERKLEGSTGQRRTPTNAADRG